MSHQHDIIIFNTTNAYPKLFTTPAYTTPESFTPPTETSDEFTPPPKISYDITPPSTKTPIVLTPTLRRYQRILLQNHQPRFWTTSHFQQPRLRKIVHNAQTPGPVQQVAEAFLVCGFVGLSLSQVSAFDVKLCCGALSVFLRKTTIAWAGYLPFVSYSRQFAHSAGPCRDLVVAGVLVSFLLSVIDVLIYVLKDCWFWGFWVGVWCLFVLRGRHLGWWAFRGS